jgi:N-methylhydantoinase A/oxoprolinase/acetone carboxylase beta subunit
MPGPACYGRGGTRPTVTDADLVLGRIDPDATFPDLGRLDVAAARRALARADTPAAGVVAVVDAAMQQAVRAVTVARGIDPRSLALVAFGGAGPLHACAVADVLDMPSVIVPPRAGALSAVGLLASPQRREVVRSWARPDDTTGLDDARRDLADAAVRLVGPGADVETGLDCRYAGQSHEITVPTVAAFPAEHQRRNGYTRPDVAVEVVALRARASRAAPLRPDQLPAVDRATVVGPAVAAEADCTVWVPAGWAAQPGPLGCWLLARESTR